MTTSLLKRRLPRQFVLEQFPKHSVGAEVGVWLGDFSCLMLKVVEPKSLHLIDPWRYETGTAYSKSPYGGSRGRNQAKMDVIHNLAQRRFARQIASGIVHIHRQTCDDAASQFPDEYFDWIYVDGNHQYEFVKNDLQALYPKVKNNGFVTGDDYGTTGWWDGGVTRAVDECIAKGLCDVVLIQDNQYILRKKQHTGSFARR